MIIHHCSTGDCDICRRQKVEWLESELSSLRAENERLREKLATICIKRRFVSSEAVQQDIDSSPQLHVRLYAYHCDLCGYWHKTKHNPEEWAKLQGAGEARKGE